MIAGTGGSIAESEAFFQVWLPSLQESVPFGGLTKGSRLRHHQATAVMVVS